MTSYRYKSGDSAVIAPERRTLSQLLQILARTGRVSRQASIISLRDVILAI